MSKLDDVLDGTYEEPEVDPVEPNDEELAAIEEAEEELAEITGGYATAEEILTAEANGELTSEEAIALLDELEDADPAPEPDDDGAAEAPAGPIAGPGDTVRILATGELATVAHMTGNGAVALAGEERPKRTVARDGYVLVD